jgi:hypothetical protein
MSLKNEVFAAVLAIFLVCGGVSQAKCVPHGPTHGSVFVAGGEDLNELAARNTEFFDPAAGAWKTACPTKSAHDEAQIALSNGNILVIGGETTKAHSKAVEAYMPATGTIKKAPSMKAAREDFVALQLNDGSILAVGGFDKKENPLSTAEVFTNGWKLLANKTTVPRGAHCGVVMTGGAKSGQVLIAGGTSAGESSPNLNSAEVFNPATGGFTATQGHMVVARAYCVATALPDGMVLITGGIDNSLNSRNTAEVYDPGTDSFTQTVNNMSVARADHSATLLPDGTVLVAGGETSFLAATTKLNTAELYDPASGKFSAPMLMNDHRDDNTATVISGSGTALDGQVLIEGGFSTFTPRTPRRSTIR